MPHVQHRSMAAAPATDRQMNTGINTHTHTHTHTHMEVW